MDMDYIGVDAAADDCLKAGRYALEIQGLDSNKVFDNEKHTKAIMVTVNVLDGPEQDDGSSPIGAVKTFFLYYPTPAHKDGGKACAFRINAFLDACDFADERAAHQAIDDADFISKRFYATVKVEDSAEYGKREGFDRFAAVQG